MDFRDELRKEHSKAQTTKIADYVAFNRPRFKKLVEVYLAGPYRITQRAAWPLSVCVERHPDLIRPHLGQILSAVSKPHSHDAVKRNTVRLLQFIDVPARYRGRVADLCFKYLQDRREPIAVRVFSMTVLHHLTTQLPDLKRDLILLIEDELPYASPAFRSRARGILKQMPM